MHLIRVFCVMYLIAAQSDGKSRKKPRTRKRPKNTRTTQVYEEYWVSTPHTPIDPDERSWPIVNTQQKHPTHTNDVKDWVSRQDKFQLIEFAEQLVSETYYSFKQTDQIEEIMRGMVPFEVGVCIGILREKYNKVMDIYTHFYNHFILRANIYAPSAMGDRYWSSQLMSAYEKIYQLELDIEHRIEMLEDIPEDVLELDMQGSIKAVMKEQALELAQSGLRSSQRRAASMVAERRFKSQLRQQYLLRALDLPTNMSTTKKRFIDKWPVEDTWDEIVRKGY